MSEKKRVYITTYSFLMVSYVDLRVSVLPIGLPLSKYDFFFYLKLLFSKTKIPNNLDLRTGVYKALFIPHSEH